MSPPNCVGLTVCITARYSSLLPKALLICCLLAPPASSGKGGGNRESERERGRQIYPGGFFLPIFQFKSFFTRQTSDKPFICSTVSLLNRVTAGR